LGQRNVHPVKSNLLEPIWEKLPFWLRNHDHVNRRLDVDISVPKWLAERGWKFSVPKAPRGTTIKAGQRLEVALAAASGSPVYDQTAAGQRDRHIAVTVLYDGAPAGGMTFELTPATGGHLRGKRRRAQSSGRRRSARKHR